MYNLICIKRSTTTKTMHGTLITTEYAVITISGEEDKLLGEGKSISKVCLTTAPKPRLLKY